MGAIVWVFLGLLAVAVFCLAWVLFQIMRQQGRLLLRLESLERLGPGAELAGSVEANGSPRQERGLSLATLAPPFQLSDLDGRLVALEDFRGQRVLLVHWDTGCGFCDQIAPELARLQGDLRKHKTERSEERRVARPPLGDQLRQRGGRARLRGARARLRNPASARGRARTSLRAPRDAGRLPPRRARTIQREREHPLRSAGGRVRAARGDTARYQ